MTQLIHDIEWGDPILPVVHDREWEAELKAQGSTVHDALTRVSRSHWIRKAFVNWKKVEITQIPNRLLHIGGLVVSQENACRYCYGVARSMMRVAGYSEKLINHIEREMQLAELDEMDGAFIQFCRNLARSNPRPAKAERDKLIALGFTPPAVTEMAFFITSHCFFNRVSTFISAPPPVFLERLSGGLVGRLLRPLLAKQLKPATPLKLKPLPEDTASLPLVVRALAGLPAASLLNETMEEAFASPVLSQRLKILMFAVVARSLDCDLCHNEMREMFLAQGFSNAEFDAALSSLRSPSLNEQEAKILPWTRETVHYQTGAIQKRNRSLAQDVDEEGLLEAIGIAALANTTVRLAMLLK